MTDRKQPEFILGVNKPAFLDYFYQQPTVGPMTSFRQIDPRQLQEELYYDLLLKPRLTLEESPAELHWIMYGIVRNRTTGKVLVYDRPSKNNGEVKLAGKRSIGIGGHVDLPDVKLTGGQIELYDTLFTSAFREFGEEVSFVNAAGQPVTIKDFHGTVSHIGVLYDPSDAVGRRHIGVVFSLWIGDDVEPVSGEDQILNPRMLSIEDALQEESTFENWSKILLYSLLQSE